MSSFAKKYTLIRAIHVEAVCSGCYTFLLNMHDPIIHLLRASVNLSQIACLFRYIKANSLIHNQFYEYSGMNEFIFHTLFLICNGINRQATEVKTKNYHLKIALNTSITVLQLIKLITGSERNGANRIALN